MNRNAPRPNEKADVPAAPGVLLRDRILPIISHDLRTPLNAIQTWTHVLEHRLLEFAPQKDAGAVRALAGIRAGVEQQVRLLDDLLDLTHAISGKLDLVRQPFELCSAAHAVVEAMRAEAQKTDIRLACDCLGEPVTIVGDRVRVQQAIGKLLSMAVDRSVAGGTIAAVVRAPSSAADPMACVHIQFPERASLNEPLANLAETDFLDEATAHEAGLGFLLARALVELHGGTIAARRRKEESPGTTVSIFLPRAGCLPGNWVA